MDNEVRFGSRQIYILPTRPGLMYALVVLALLLAAVNYANALAYLFTFLLASLGIVSIVHTQRNLLGLQVNPANTGSCFCGQNAEFRICLHNNSTQKRRAIHVTADAVNADTEVDVPARDVVCFPLLLPTTRRGWQTCPSFFLATHFPLGLMRAWTRRVTPEVRALVYPRPAESSVLPVSPETEAVQGIRIEGDDFAGLRSYQSGDAPARISWKTLARGQGMHTKDFAAEAGQSLWLEWSHYAPHDTETRLALLCRAVLEAEAAGRLYGLDLPGFRALPNQGAEHRHHCLTALALYEESAA